jgi:hypothetical protein
MPLLCETRPTRSEVFRNATTRGGPGEGMGSGLDWVAYHFGSTQSSATHCVESGGAVLAPGSTAADGPARRGIAPVVWSYPQASQNSASAALAAPQFGQEMPADASPPPEVDAPGAGPATAPAASTGPLAGSGIASPQTSQ